MRLTVAQRLMFIAFILSLTPASTVAQATLAPSGNSSSELKFVVYLSRHGVRSPTGLPAEYALYSLAPWPAWDVPPGYLTAHGYQLMKLFGAYDQLELAKEGLLSASGCEDASKISFYADSDERTRETGKAVAEGLFPECHVSVQFLPEGTNDPLFHYHPTPAELGDKTPIQAAAAIGESPNAG